MSETYMQIFDLKNVCSTCTRFCFLSRCRGGAFRTANPFVAVVVLAAGLVVDDGDGVLGVHLWYFDFPSTIKCRVPNC